MWCVDAPNVLPNTPNTGDEAGHRAWGRLAARCRPTVVEEGLARVGGVVRGGLAVYEEWESERVVARRSVMYRCDPLAARHASTRVISPVIVPGGD